MSDFLEKMPVKLQVINAVAIIISVISFSVALTSIYKDTQTQIVTVEARNKMQDAQIEELKKQGVDHTDEDRENLIKITEIQTDVKYIKVAIDSIEKKISK